MKYSVVLPAHNGLELVKDACYSVLEKLPEDGELIVFDNSSEEDFRSFERNIDNPQFKLIRSERFLPVTESWNAAFDLASGDYVFFLGSDDGLAPCCFDLVDELIKRFDGPEAIYGALYQFFHPGVASWQPEGYLKEMRYAFFFKDTSEPFLLSSADAKRAVLGSLNFKRNFTFNSQAFVLHKNLIKRLRGPSGLFQSPYPDYYLSNVIMAKSQSTVISPRPFSIAGVAKGSFGYMLFNGLVGEGEAYLNTDISDDPIYKEVSDKLLPGNPYDTKYAITMAYVARDTAEEINSGVDWNRYRRFQIYTHIFRMDGQNLISTAQEKGLWGRLSVGEKIFMLLLGLTFRMSKLSSVLKRIFDKQVTARLSPYRTKSVDRIMDVGELQSLREVYDALRDKYLL